MHKIEPINQHNKLIGFTFYCPGCEMQHLIYTDSAGDNNPIWAFNGDHEKPTFNPSLLITYSRNKKLIRCHSFIRGGKIQYLKDSTHKLAGEIIDMLDIEKIQ